MQPPSPQPSPDHVQPRPTDARVLTLGAPTAPTPLTVLPHDVLLLTLSGVRAAARDIGCGPALCVVVSLCVSSQPVAAATHVWAPRAEEDSPASDPDVVLKLPLAPTLISGRFVGVAMSGYRLKVQLFDGSGGMQDGYVGVGDADISGELAAVLPPPPGQPRVRVDAPRAPLTAILPLHNRTNAGKCGELHLSFACARPATDPFTCVPDVWPVPPRVSCWIVVTVKPLECFLAWKADRPTRRGLWGHPGTLHAKAILCDTHGQVLCVGRSGDAVVPAFTAGGDAIVWPPTAAPLQLCYHRRVTPECAGEDVGHWSVRVEVWVEGGGYTGCVGTVDTNLRGCVGHVSAL